MINNTKINLALNAVSLHVSKMVPYLIVILLCLFLGALTYLLSSIVFVPGITTWLNTSSGGGFISFPHSFDVVVILGLIAGLCCFRIAIHVVAWIIGMVIAALLNLGRKNK